MRKQTTPAAVFIPALFLCAVCGCSHLFDVDSAIQKALLTSGKQKQTDWEKLEQEVQADLESNRTSEESGSDRATFEYPDESATQNSGRPVGNGIGAGLIQDDSGDKRFPSHKLQSLANPSDTRPRYSTEEHPEFDSAWDKIERSVLSDDQGQNQNQVALSDPETQVISIRDSSRPNHSLGVQFSAAKRDPVLPLIQMPEIVSTSVESIQLPPTSRNSDSEITWRDSLDATIRHLQQELKSDQVDFRQSEHLQKCLEVLSVIETGNENLVNLVSRLKTLKKSLPAHHFDALTRVIAKTETNGANQNELIAMLRSAISQVNDSAKLVIENARICTEVSGFGQFKEFSLQEFKPGDQVLVYCELKNFSQRELGEDEDHWHECRFDAQLQFLNSNGEIDHVKSFADILDKCRRPRTDFYLFFRLEIPALKKGEHTLQIRIHDKVGRKRAFLEQPVKLTIQPAE